MKTIFVILLCLFLWGTASAQENPYDVALERIRANERSQNTSLSLAGIDLAELPPQIGRLTHLETLWLDHNELQSLPPEIGQLESLQNLFISHNQLQSLPAEIGNLAQLNELNLSYNQLQSLPASMGNLAKLDELYLANNQLSQLPPTMGDLSALTWLDLANNRLSGLPPEMGRLSLNHIDVSGNLPPLRDIANLDAKVILTYTQVNIIWRFWPLLIVIGVLIAVGIVAYSRRRKPTKRRSIKNRA